MVPEFEAEISDMVPLWPELVPFPDCWQVSPYSACLSPYLSRMPRAPSRTRVQTESHALTLAAKDLDDIKTGRYERFQLLSEDEARYWLQQWRDGIKRGQDPTRIKNPGRRERPEVREGQRTKPEKDHYLHLTKERTPQDRDYQPL